MQHCAEKVNCSFESVVLNLVRGSFKKCVRRAEWVLKKQTKTNRGRGDQAYQYVRSVIKFPDFQTAGRVLSDKLLGSC